MMVLLLALGAFAAGPERTCGLPPLLPTRPAGGPVPAEGPRLRDAAPKAVRDAFGSFDTHETENFAIKWGAMTSFTQADVEALGEAFERSWAIEVVQMGYPQPLQTTSYKFNVYLGDTGEGTPSAAGNAGYYWYDDDGFPMIVIAGDSVEDRPWVALTAAHEFFHAVQDAVGVFEWAPRAAWWSEASAVWMEGAVYPDNPDQAYFLYWFAIRPELSLTFYEYPQDGNPEEYHQYGAFVFLEHLEENVGGAGLIHDVMTGTPAGGDPLETLDAVLDADGSDFDVVFDEFVGRNATWDYDHEDWYDDLIDALGGWTGDSHRPTGTLADDTRGFVEVPYDPPKTWGANYWRLRGFEGDEVLGFDGALDGEDAPRAWSVQVALQEGNEHRRIPMSLVDGKGTLTASEVGAYDEAWLVVAPMDLIRGTRTWTYAVSFEGRDDGPDDTGEEAPRACGCATTGSGAALGWVVAAWAMRRRGRAAGRRGA